MTARQPRRSRQRRAPSAALPRPVMGAAPAQAARPQGPASVPASSGPAAQRRAMAPREHHVKTDYSYVKKDLLLVGAVGAIVLAFIVAMSQIV